MPNADERLRQRLAQIIYDGTKEDTYAERIVVEIMIEIEHEIINWRNINFNACSPLNEYHKGMCNGMEFVRSLIAADEPKYI